MAVEFNELPGWQFDADEISAGVFKVIGMDQQGQSVEAIGPDPDELIRKCKQDALRVMRAHTEDSS